MTGEDRAVLCSPNLKAACDWQFEQLTRLFDGEVPARPFCLWGVNGRGTCDPYTEPEQWVVEALASLMPQAEHLSDGLVFRPLCVEFGPYGVHFVDRLFGARVYEHEGQWWSECLRTPVGALAAPDLAADETWRLARRTAAAFTEQRVSVPLFGLPTIASALNIAANLYGEPFLEATVTHPEAAGRDLATINGVLADLHRWYLAHIPLAQLQPVVAAQRCQPPGSGQLCGCTTHLLSASAYRDLVAPFDNALLSVYPRGGMIHLCGAHTQHLPVWREMRSLRAVQLNDRAADDLDAYVRGLRDDQVIYLNPSCTMTVERAIEIAGGRRLVIVADAADLR